MQRLLCRLPLSVAFVLALLWTGPAFALSPDLEAIRERGVLRVAVYGKDIPPFLVRTPQGLDGVDANLARTVAARLGVRVVFDETAETFDQVVGKVFRGEADLGVSLLSASLARSLMVSFTDAYASVHPALLLNRLTYPRGRVDFEAAAETSADAAELHAIGVLAGSVYSEYVGELFQKVQARSFPDSAAMLQAMKDGEIGAVLQSEIFLNQLLNADPSWSLRFRVEPIMDRLDPIACAVNWRSRGLLQWINLCLRLGDAHARPPVQSMNSGDAHLDARSAEDAKP